MMWNGASAAHSMLYWALCSLLRHRRGGGGCYWRHGCLLERVCCLVGAGVCLALPRGWRGCNGDHVVLHHGLVVVWQALVVQAARPRAACPALRMPYLSET